MDQRNWKDSTVQQLIRYEALFDLLNTTQGIRLADMANQVASQWKYFANVHAWHLIVFDGKEFLQIDGYRGKARYQTLQMDELSSWDAHYWKEQRPFLLHTVENHLHPPEHILTARTSQIQILPINNQEKSIALLTISCQNQDFDELDLRFIKLMGSFFSNHLLSLMLQKRADNHLRRQATRDSLTDILNRGAILEQLNTTMHLSKRNNYPFSILLIDVDFFKKINDNYGHQAGDSVLQDLAKRLEDKARDSDSVGRYGGEEFLVILHNCGIDQLEIVAERFRESISNHSFLLDLNQFKEISVTISIGAASFEINENMDLYELIKRADKALYESKKQGRNRSTVC